MGILLSEILIQRCLFGRGITSHKVQSTHFSILGPNTRMSLRHQQQNGTKEAFGLSASAASAGLSGLADDDVTGKKRKHFMTSSAAAAAATSAAVKSEWTSPSLFHHSFRSFTSDGKVRLEILRQPERQHRARYQTEGSRGAVKDRSQNMFPTVQLKGKATNTTDLY